MYLGGACTGKECGFTLIELMIVVAIIGILAAISYPSYQQYVEKSRRVDAMTVLMEASQFMERSYTLDNEYPTSLPDPLTESPTSGSKTFYSIAIDENLSDKQSYTLVAQPVGVQASDDCGDLSLSNTGARAPADCWN